MRRFAGSCRFVFNRALALQKELFELSGAHASYAAVCCAGRLEAGQRDGLAE
jgi:putative transposase